MSELSHGDEARRALAGIIELGTSGFADNQATDFCMRAKDWRLILAALRADPVRAAEEMRERCLKAALGASYGPPSSWPGDYPKGWRHPPAWNEDKKPTPRDASWHDNGARDAWFGIRALPAQPVAEGGAE